MHVHAYAYRRAREGLLSYCLIALLIGLLLHEPMALAFWVPDQGTKVLGAAV